MQNKNIIIGIGNLLFCDDGVGVIAIHYLQENFDFFPDIELLDGGTLGFNLSEYFLNYDNVFIIDTISTNDEAGSIYKIPSDALLANRGYKNTAHEVEVVQMLEACELYDKKAKITIFAIVPEDIQSVKIGLSNLVIGKFDKLIEALINELQTLGISANKKEGRGLQEIIKDLK